MRIEKLELKNFRCFDKIQFDFSADIVLIYGNNGAGKTTIIEALHYLCYLSSFRSRLPSEIAQIRDETISQNFFIKGTITQEDHEILDLQVGFDKKKKLAKLGQKPIASYKELFAYYQVVTLTIDDLELIQGSPSVRRHFIDQAIALVNPEFIQVSKRYQQILEQRNSLLRKPFTQESYEIWTHELWKLTIIIAQERINHLNRLKSKILQLLHDFFDADYHFDVIYNSKHVRLDESFNQFLERKSSLIHYETMMKHSDFGAHLDDFTLLFCHKKLKSFGSRGQQKLFALLIKVAQILDLQEIKSKPIFLLDDFVTDFDKKRLESILALLLTLDCQLIITSPIREKLLEELLPASKISTIELH
ncbi:MAG: DNA replication/repair protein RecF [Candidatus Chromulinivorax sp.]